MDTELYERAVAFCERVTDGERCPFCGHDPYEYVDVGVGGRGVRVAVTCCDLGIGLIQYGDEGLVKVSNELHEASSIIRSMLKEMGLDP